MDFRCLTRGLQTLLKARHHFLRLRLPAWGAGAFSGVGGPPSLAPLRILAPVKIVYSSGGRVAKHLVDVRAWYSCQSSYQ
jgi:hypothetical protein